MNTNQFYINRLRRIPRTGCALGCGIFLLILWGVVLFLNEFKWHILLAISLFLIAKKTYDFIGTKNKLIRYLFIILYLFIYVFFTIHYL